jgi:hypothetical protein
MSNRMDDQASLEILACTDPVLGAGAAKLCCASWRRGMAAI